MGDLAEKLGELAARAIAGAIAAGKSRKEALDAGAEAIRRQDVVSDDLWRRVDRYVQETQDFEEHGA